MNRRSLFGNLLGGMMGLLGTGGERPDRRFTLTWHRVDDASLFTYPEMGTPNQSKGLGKVNAEPFCGHPAGTVLFAEMMLHPSFDPVSLADFAPRVTWDVEMTFQRVDDGDVRERYDFSRLFQEHNDVRRSFRDGTWYTEVTRKA